MAIILLAAALRPVIVAAASMQVDEARLGCHATWPSAEVGMELTRQGNHPLLPQTPIERIRRVVLPPYDLVSGEIREVQLQHALPITKPSEV